MNPFRRLLLAAMVAAAALGLSSCAKSRAVINDLGPVHARILDVDGRPVERARGKYVTVIPEVLVEPGLHALRVRFEKDSQGAVVETLRVSARVDAGKRYQFAVHDGALQLIEEPKEQ